MPKLIQTLVTLLTALSFTLPLGGQTGATLLAHGAPAGDVTMARGDDTVLNLSLAGLGFLGTTPQIPVFSQTFSSLSISTNGFLALGTLSSQVASEAVSAFPQSTVSNPILAPFLADVDTRNTASGQIWYRPVTLTNPSALASFSSVINNSFLGVTDFHATFAEVVTWDGVGYFGNRASPLNTFQLLLATNGVRTYTVFLYPSGGINWLLTPDANQGNPYPLAGFDAHDGVNYYNVPGSRTSAMGSLASSTNTVTNQTGTFAFSLTPNAVTTTTYSGTPTTVTVTNTAAETLQLGASGFTFTGGAGSFLQFQTLSLAQPTDTVSFTGSLTTAAYAGNAITSGQLNLGGSTSFYATAASALNGGTFNLSSNAQLTIFTSASTNATSVTFDNTSGGTGGTLSVSTTTLGAISSVATGAGLITGSGALTIDSSTSSTFSGVIQNNGSALSLIKSGSGTLTLSGPNTYTGGTTLSAGTLALGASGVLADTGAVTLNGGTLALGTFNETVGAFSLSSGSLTGTGTLTASSLAFSNASALSIATPLAGSGALTKTGAGTLTLSATNSYTGGTAINGGVVAISANTQLGATSGALSFDGGTLRLTAGGIAIGRAPTLNAGGGTVDVTTGSSQFGSAISGSGAFTKTGAGTLTFLGANSYSGPTTIAQGLLQIGNGGATGVLPGDAVDNATLTFNRNNAVTYAGAVTGTGVINKNGTGELTLAGSFAQTGGTTINNGTLTLGASNRLADTGAVTLNGGTLALGAFTETIGAFVHASGSLTGTGTLTASSFTLSAAGTIDAVLAGSGNLAKSGAGALTLTGANTYTGTTTITAGTLIVNGSLAHTATAINSGATLGGSGTIGGPATFASGAHLAPGNSPGTLTFTNGLTLTAGSILDFQLGTTSDLIRVTGGTLTGPDTGNLITFNLSDAGGFHAGTYDVLNYTTASGTVGFGASNFTLGSSIAGYTYNFTTNSGVLQLTATASAIPEPAAYAAIFGALALGLVTLQRRRRPSNPVDRH